MTWAQEMKNLAADIKSSHRDRTARLSEIKDETKEIRRQGQQVLKDADAFMRNVRTDLTQAAKDLKDFLAGSEKKRMAEFNNMMRDIKGDLGAMKRLVTELLKSTKDLIEGYAAERKEAAGYWARLGGREETIPTGQASPKPRKKARRKK